jgi:hypothetical protein
MPFKYLITLGFTQIVKNPTSTIEQLAARLPDASIFFLTYIGEIDMFDRFFIHIIDVVKT